MNQPGWSKWLGKQAAINWAALQVQDVGLIFLSAMATAIVHEGTAKGIEKADILGTTLLTLTLSTFIVGLLIILVGKLALACMRS